MFTIWLSFIIIGGSFYNYEDGYGWDKGLYYAVNGIIMLILLYNYFVIVITTITIIINSWF